MHNKVVKARRIFARSYKLVKRWIYTEYNVVMFSTFNS